MIHHQSIIHLVIICNVYLLNGESGTATWFEGNPSDGACGYNTVATTTFPFDYYAAVGGDLWNNGYQCGACYRIKCIGPYSSESNGCGCTDTPSVTVQIVDQCPECRTTRPDVDFDLSLAAQSKISTCDTTHIEFERVQCDYFATNIKIRSKSVASQWWYGLHIDHVAANGAINQVFIKSSDDNSWITCSKSNGPSYWLCNNGLPLTNATLPFDIKFIDDKGTELVSPRAITSFSGNQEFDAGVQYEISSESVAELSPSSKNSGSNNNRRKRERRKNEEKCAARRCCNARDGLKQSNLPNGLNCKALSDEKCGEFDEFCEWDCSPPKYKNKNNRKFKRKFRRISAQKGQYKQPNPDQNDQNTKGTESYEECMSEGKLISIDDCGVEYEEEMDVNERETFCKYHLKDNVSRHGGTPSGNGDLEPDPDRRRLAVIGEDTRIQVTSKSFPYSAVLGTYCTTTMISPRWAITAAHCVYSSEDGDWNDNYGVLYKNVVGCSDKTDSNRYTVTNKYVLSSYLDEGGSARNDIAWVRLNAEPNVGYLDFGYDDSFSGEHNFYIIQYPTDKPACTKWTIYCAYDEWFTEQMNTHECDTFSGSSGSAIYKYYASGSRIIYGIHRGGITDVVNVATRITAGRYNLLCSYVERDHPGHCDPATYSEIQSFGGKCLDIHVDDLYTNGGKVQIWDCNGQIQQQWYYDSATNRIKNEGGKCLDVDYDDYVANTNGALVQIWDCNSNPNQKWTINGNQIRSENGKCLDVWQSWLDINGGGIQLWDCNINGQTNQLWSF